jgi:hypothetical protein
MTVSVGSGFQPGLPLSPAAAPVDTRESWERVRKTVRLLVTVPARPREVFHTKITQS